MKTAIVAHHRRKRSRDRLGYVALGFFTCTFAYCFYDAPIAESWSIWKKIEFPSGYATIHQQSLQNNNRQVEIDNNICRGYEQLRQRAAKAQ